MNNNKKYIIYRHTSPSGKCYIGQTCQKITIRSGLKGQNYTYVYNNKRYKQPIIAAAINKYGWENFKHEVLFEGLNKVSAYLIEKDLIYYYKSINKSYNITDGGEGVSGKIPWNKGIKLSQIRTSKLKGIPFTEEHKQHLRKPKIITDFSRCKAVKVYDLEGNYITTFSSISEAQKTLNVNNVKNVLDGKRNHSGKYQFIDALDETKKPLKLDPINGRQTYPIVCKNIVTKEVRHYNSWFQFPRDLNIKISSLKLECVKYGDNCRYREWIIEGLQIDKKIKERRYNKIPIEVTNINTGEILTFSCKLEFLKYLGQGKTSNIKDNTVYKDYYIKYLFVEPKQIEGDVD